MAFANINNPAGPAMDAIDKAIAQAQADAVSNWSNDFNAVEASWLSVWRNPDPTITPTAYLARLGVNAVQAFTLLGAYVACLAATAHCVGADADTDLMGKLALYATTDGWVPTMNQDGSVTVTPPAT